jgi:hypothetical protein
MSARLHRADRSVSWRHKAAGVPLPRRMADPPPPTWQEEAEEEEADATHRGRHY